MICMAGPGAVQRVLLVGCGDIALRTAALLRGRARLYGVVRRAEETGRLRSAGIVPIVADLDLPRSLWRLHTAPFAVLHFAPPPGEGHDDPRTRHLVAALAKARIIPQRFVYLSTSGVYGDCAGARVAETRPARARTPRARRRASAEHTLRAWAARRGVSLAVLRVPAIYADTRLPLDRIRHGTPTLRVEDDVYVNHIHADDLARAVVAALFRGRSNRTYNVSDDAPLKLATWLDAVAEALHLPRPARIAWEEAEQRIAPQLLSFMSVSRRLANERMKRELRVQLAYPEPYAFLHDIGRRGRRRQIPLPLDA
jgi:nucleoside-diphosphate-sugar epimerase